MKYIITDRHEVVIGNASMFHADLAGAVEGTVIAAGHVHIRGDELITDGSSVGFGIKAQPRDAETIARYLYDHS